MEHIIFFFHLIKMENIKVFIRIRPLNKKESTKENIVSTNGNSVQVSNSTFNFDSVFTEQSKQEDIFEKTKDAVNWVCEGYNSTIFAYGATSSGKSYTMFGSKTEKGIIPRCCELLFHNINNNEKVSEANLKISFIEIYREQIIDLLYTEEHLPLRMRYLSGKGVYIQGVVEKYVNSTSEILKIIENGMVNRTTASTSLNNTSSRSHALLCLTLTQIFDDGTETSSKLNLVDLAGSENVGRSEVQGISLLEAQTINKSLSCLGNVINALTEKGREHVPYRDSKLTFILQDSLGGNSKTILIATISPSILCQSETLMCLKFAKRVKEIKNAPKINRSESHSNLLKTIEELKNKISELELKCEESQKIINNNGGDKDLVEISILKTRCDRFEKRISGLEQLIGEEEERDKQFRHIFEKQKELTQNISKELYEEKIKNFNINNQLDRYKLLFETLKISDQEVLKIILDRTKLI
jgi:kinesin family protein 5